MLGKSNRVARGQIRDHLPNADTVVSSFPYTKEQVNPRCCNISSFVILTPVRRNVSGSLARSLYLGATGGLHKGEEE
ncbi:hypothetical protein HZH66_000075 [Vespula vulgaris]|uniref:Uncharacterized protein n=2 Tax=Vespula TaxID=7451 RepID=A0A834KTT9_VESVU|nr:hypothetical protein HZH66_000075 [Vespula vulgaris]